MRDNMVMKIRVKFLQVQRILELQGSEEPPPLSHLISLYR